MTKARDLADFAGKADTIETSATADQTAAEIRAAVEAATDSNVFTDADHTKLNAIEASSTGDQTAAQILTAIKTVDGAASALDADLLDGQHGAYYTGYADTAVSNLVDSSPASLNTLNELAAALGDDANFSTTVTNSIAAKLPLAGGAMTGAITTNSTFDGVDIATRDGVLTTTTNTANAALPKAGGALTGVLTTNSSVGIGVSPTNPLHVSSSLANSVVSYFHNTDTSNGQGILVRGGGSNSGKYIAQFQDAAANTRMQILANGNVGIGSTVFTSARVTAPHLVVGSGSNSPGLTLYGSANSQGSINFADSTSGTASYDGGLIYAYGSGSPNMTFHVNGGTERMRIDASGAMMVGTTTSRPAEFSHPDGFAVRADVKGQIQNTVTNANCGVFNRDGSDGEIFQFRKDGSTVGSIGKNSGGLYIGSGDAGITMEPTLNAIIPTNSSNGAYTDNLLDVGYSTKRFKDAYLSGGIFLGGTGGANKLSDVEIGTFTPTWDGYSPAGSTGRYQKVGRTVTVHMQLVTGTNADYSGVQVNNLPFTAQNAGGIGSGMTWTNNNGPYAAQLMTRVLQNTTICRINCLQGGSLTGLNYVGGTVSIGGSGTFEWTVVYETT